MDVKFEGAKKGVIRIEIQRGQTMQYTREKQQNEKQRSRKLSNKNSKKKKKSGHELNDPECFQTGIDI